MRLKLERFGLPNKPSETPEQLEELVRCGDWGRGPRAPSPCPYPKRGQPLCHSFAVTPPLTQGRQYSVVSLAPLYPQGSRSEPEA